MTTTISTLIPVHFAIPRTIHARYKALAKRHDTSVAHLIAIAMTISANSIETMKTETLVSAFGPGMGKLKTELTAARKRGKRLEHHIEVRNRKDKLLRPGQVVRGSHKDPPDEVS